MSKSQVPGLDREPLISVIVVSWNARSYLEECLQSLNREACRYPMEIIVVDNASTDGSPEAVRERFPDVFLIRNSTNLGFAKANNLGIKRSRGEYLCLINSDVKVLAGCITTLVEYMEAHTDVGVAGPTMLDSNGKIGGSCRGFPTVWNMFCYALGLDLIFPKVECLGSYTLRHWPHNTTRRVDILGGWFWIVRRQALEKVGLLDESFFFYAEDMDWCKEFNEKGFAAVFVADAAAIHYGGGSSKSKPAQYVIQQQRADLQYWRKRHSRIETVLYAMICVMYHFFRLVGHSLMLLWRPRDDDRFSKVQLSWYSLRWLLTGMQ